ncbi:B3 domain-containing protein At3g18960-like [Gastrolobium bilobum]|uniref:B3 domain-containing protein At3g18960-like n=1 Tax=Gastrolobium bilobum TaxID=150636 RepID=UPI002AB1CDE4|nr:B3 domain-containing protein At3g18960-like [Gastrolobium bilobum]
MSSQGCDHHGYGVHFFKIILESNIRDGELRVPRSFVRRHWQGISNPVCLRLPNSTEWKVYWMKRDGDVWFRNGWKEFAQYLSLDVSQFVVFRYEENSYFNVIIFDKSALEIKYPSRVADEKSEEVNESDYSLKILENCSPFEGKREKTPSPSSQTRKKMKTNPKEEQGDAGFDNAKHMNSE